MDPRLRSIELTVISGESLSLDRSQQPVKKNVFVTVQPEYSKETHSTSTNTDGGFCPQWNQKILVNMPMHARFLTLGVYKRTNVGNQLLGSVNVPVTDFTGVYFPSDYLHFLSYRLRDKRGRRNGIINLSVRVKSSEKVNSTGSACAAASGMQQPWAVPTACCRAPVGQDVTKTNVVTGIPVLHKY